MYAMVATWPNIAHTMGVVSSFMQWSMSSDIWWAHKTVASSSIRTITHAYLGTWPKLCRLCGQLEVNYQWLLLIQHWCNFMEIETSRVHDHFDDRSWIYSCDRHGERSFMARSVSMHISASQLYFASSVLQRQLGCCHLIEESNPR